MLSAVDSFNTTQVLFSIYNNSSSYLCFKRWLLNHSLTGEERHLIPEERDHILLRGTYHWHQSSNIIFTEQKSQGEEVINPSLSIHLFFSSFQPRCGQSCKCDGEEGAELKGGGNACTSRSRRVCVCVVDPSFTQRHHISRVKKGRKEGRERGIVKAVKKWSTREDAARVGVSH